MQIEEKHKLLHGSLSAAARRLLEFTETHPALLHDNVRDWVTSSYPLQPVPTLVGGAKLEMMRQAALELPRLVKSIPRLAFDDDPQRICDYYGLSGAAEAAELLAPPNGFAGALARPDFIDGPDGFKCLEVNLGNRLGGWQGWCYREPYLSYPPVAELLAETGIAVSFRDTFEALYRHVAEEATAAGLVTDGTLNLLLATLAGEQVALDETLAAVDRGYARFVGEQFGLAGRFLVAPFEELTLQGAHLHAGDTRIHAVLKFTFGPLPPHLHAAWKAGAFNCYNGSAPRLLVDKRNLALLSRLETSERLSPAEQETVRRHLPWTRELAASEELYDGESIRLPDAVLADRGRFVIKPATGLSGKSVFVGSFTTQEEWEGIVADAMGKGKWIVQERVESFPYLYQTGDFGCAPHDVVWGLFAFGRHYGGGFLRMLPSDRQGIVNNSKGATFGMLFEVEEG